MPARPVDDLAIGIQQCIQVIDQRLNLDGIVALQETDLAAPDFLEIAADIAQRQQPAADHGGSAKRQEDGEYAERQRDKESEGADILRHGCRVAGDKDRVVLVRAEAHIPFEPAQLAPAAPRKDEGPGGLVGSRQPLDVKHVETERFRPVRDAGIANVADLPVPAR
jgi:hypothetical protein